MLIKHGERALKVQALAGALTGPRDIIRRARRANRARMQEFTVGDGADPAAKRTAPPGGATTPGRHERSLCDVIPIADGAGEAAREGPNTGLVSAHQFLKSFAVAAHGGGGQNRIALSRPSHVLDLGALGVVGEEVKADEGEPQKKREDGDAKQGPHRFVHIYALARADDETQCSKS